MIFDTHTHLNVEDFAGIEEEELALAKEHNVTEMAIVGFDYPTIEQSIALSDKYENLYSIIGWHPTEAGDYNQEVEDYLLKNMSNPKVIGWGEIGLDYHWMTSPKEVQEAVFRRQIALSKEVDLPFIVHTRDALEDTYEIIKSEGVGPRGGIMHSFSGNYEEAKKFMDLGMHISFSGVVTFKKTIELQEAAQKLPLDKILVETDAPYLAPMPYRGKQNHSAYTKYVVEKIADLRGMTYEEVAKQTQENAHKLFGLEKK
ncbi:hydrolase TatD [Floricoccus tropicus]|uniref:Hydrolase TatD n=1 Tax=Floricoccus tropicus TaxID=1859473 RepID=A0A1E8GL07_9LACT|nr:TatD family hydrolase [Floricoccus tropicus]OFI48646.1 hydrolase TatD [Floricoccus tropicus]